MKINNNGLNDYSAPLIEKQHRDIFITAICIMSIILIILILFTILSLISYQIVLGYIIGAFVSMAFFYHIIKTVKECQVSDYQKVLKKMNILHQMIYLFLLVVLFFIFKNIYMLIACIAGYLLIRFAIIIDELLKRGNKKNV